MMIHPYMGIEDVWELAAMLSVDSQAPVHVLAPPPPVTWIANDKALFDELVSRVLGRDVLVETRIARDATGIEANLRAVAAHHERVGLKRTRCASAMGNAVFASCDVQSERGAAHAVEAFLRRTEWPEGEEVLAVAWLDTDLSPSTQLWIPPIGRGEPRLEGIYEQILKGEEKVFVGSRTKSSAPAPSWSAPRSKSSGMLGAARSIICSPATCMASFGSSSLNATDVGVEPACR
jgi:hypothetical protein